MYIKVSEVVGSVRILQGSIGGSPNYSHAYYSACVV